jgi:tetratricopeptide (TPR) repeat protein
MSSAELGLWNLRIALSGLPNGRQAEVGRAFREAAEAIDRAIAAVRTLVAQDAARLPEQVRQWYAARSSDESRVVYFYCKRAEELYGRLPESLRGDPSIRTAEALALNMLGLLLERTEAVRHKRKSAWHCSADGEWNEDEDGSGVLQSVRLGPYTAGALRYYRRAAVLLPQDQNIRCNVARTAWAMGDPGPMDQLRDSAGARVNLAAQLLGAAQDERDFTRMLDEYRKAVDLDPFNVDALNAIGYTVWQWHLQSQQGDPTKRPDRDALLEAEKMARKAVALTLQTADPTLRAAVHSTLGEVLLGQERAHEAAEELESTLMEGAGTGHAYFHEIRGDLVQAYLCAAKVDQESGFHAHALELKRKASRIVSEIQTSENERETQSFSENTFDSLDSLAVPPICSGVADKTRADPRTTRYRLAGGKAKYLELPVCDRIWISASVQGVDRSYDDLNLLVWGGSTRVEVSVGAKPAARSSSPIDRVTATTTTLRDSRIASPRSPARLPTPCKRIEQILRSDAPAIRSSCDSRIPRVGNGSVARPRAQSKSDMPAARRRQGPKKSWKRRAARPSGISSAALV